MGNIFDREFVDKCIHDFGQLEDEEMITREIDMLLAGRK